MFKILIFIVSISILLECLITLLFFWLKKDFQWLVNKDDENPRFDKLRFNRFLKNSFDEYLGWDRKRSTSGFELSNRKTYFKINSSGSRGKRMYKKDGISVFGDSFAFCRYVNDNETWQYNLSKKHKTNILNFGVGNYGLDQAFLKYIKNRKKIKTSKVVFCVVPETIARVFSYWKHFREFNNIFAIKPLINLKKDKPSVISIPKLETQAVSENLLRFDAKFLKKVKKEDFFYTSKFKKNMFKFPFTFSYLKNFKLNSYLFYYLIIHRVLKTVNSKYDKKYYFLACSKVFQENILDSHNLYQKVFYKRGFKRLLKFIDDFFKNKKIKYSILIVPQYYDLKLKESCAKYINFFKKLNNPNILDVSEEILYHKNWKKYYFVDKYGGHLNKQGNKLLANLLYKKNL